MMDDFLRIDKYFIAHPFHWFIFLTEDQKSMFQDMPVLLASNIVLAFEHKMEFKLIQGNFIYCLI